MSNSNNNLSNILIIIHTHKSSYVLTSIKQVRWTKYSIQLAVPLLSRFGAPPSRSPVLK